ncbi:MAG: VPLPA-CTERM-specific exosortase XrtD [Cyanobacteria bacterium P01_A01_bin.68]
MNLQATKRAISRPLLETTFFVFSGLILFYPAIENLVFRWNQNQEYSHGYFIPFVSCYLIYKLLQGETVERPRVSWTAFLFLALSIFLLYAGRITHMFVFQHAGLLSYILFLSLHLLGFSGTRIIGFPLAYLIFMIPLPYFLLYLFTAKMQGISSVLGVSIIRLFDIPVTLYGNIIDLGAYKLAVVEACSGLRYLFPFASLGALAAYFFNGKMFAKLLIVSATVPITILLNSFRIAVTALISDSFGIEHAEGFSHFFEGWMVFALCGLVFYALCVLLHKICGTGSATFQVGWLLDRKSSSTVTASASGPFQASLSLVAMISALICVLGIVGNYTVFARSLSKPERSLLVDLPYEIEGWSPVKVHRLENEMEEVLAADDYVVADLSRAQGDFVNLYVAYLDSQRDGRSWHSPRQCMPGGGWTIDTIQKFEPFAANDDTDLIVNRAVISRGSDKLLVYYWFPQRGRNIVTELDVKLYAVLDGVTRSRTDGALVRLVTPIATNGEITDPDQRLQAYLTDLLKALPAYVPT